MTEEKKKHENAEFSPIVTDFHKFYAVLEQEILKNKPESIASFKEILKNAPSSLEFPNSHERAVITFEKPKTAALFYDRVLPIISFGVPKEIRCCFGTPFELIMSAMISSIFSFFPNKIKVEDVIKGFSDFSIEEVTPEMLMKSNLDLGMFNVALRNISEYILEHTKINTSILYLSFEKYEKEFKSGDHEILITSLSNIGIIDESKLTWDQVKEIRSDIQSKISFRKFRHWLDTDMIGKSQTYIEDEIAIRLDNYKKAIKKHGVFTILGKIESIVGSDFIERAVRVNKSVSLLNSPIVNVLCNTLLVGEAAVKAIVSTNDSKGTNSQAEIAWVHEIQQKLNPQEQ